MKLRHEDVLIEHFPNRDEAFDALTQFADLLVHNGKTEKYGVFVQQVQGVWGVWLRERR